MSNEREQIESQGQKYKATPDARISRTDEGGAEPHPTYAPTLAMHLGNCLLLQLGLLQTSTDSSEPQKRDNAFNCP